MQVLVCLCVCVCGECRREESWEIGGHASLHCVHWLVTFTFSSRFLVVLALGLHYGVRQVVVVELVKGEAPFMRLC